MCSESLLRSLGIHNTAWHCEDVQWKAFASRNITIPTSRLVPENSASYWSATPAGAVVATTFQNLRSQALHRNITRVFSTAALEIRTFVFLRLRANSCHRSSSWRLSCWNAHNIWRNVHDPMHVLKTAIHPYSVWNMDSRPEEHKTSLRQEFCVDLNEIGSATVLETKTKCLSCVSWYRIKFDAKFILFSFRALYMG